LSADWLGAEVHVEAGEGKARGSGGAFLKCQNESVGCGRQFLAARADCLEAICGTCCARKIGGCGASGDIHVAQRISCNRIGISDRCASRRSGAGEWRGINQRGLACDRGIELGDECVLISREGLNVVEPGEIPRRGFAGDIHGGRSDGSNAQAGVRLRAAEVS
jgi:hypothetical protein